MNRRVGFLLLVALTLLGWAVRSGAQPVVSPRTAVARQLVDEAVKVAATIRDPKERGILRSLAKAQARLGDIPGALHSMAALPGDLVDVQNTQFAWEAIAVAQARAGDVAAALQTLGRAPAGSSGDTAMAAIATGLARWGEVALALTMVRSITDARQQDQVLVEIARVQAGGGDVAGALKTLAPLALTSGPELAEITVPLHARRGDLATALRLARTIPQPGMGPLTLISLAAYQARAGDVPGALATARQIPEGKWRDIAVYAIVAGQATGDDFAGALATAASFSRPPRPRLRPRPGLRGAGIQRPGRGRGAQPGQRLAR